MAFIVQFLPDDVIIKADVPATILQIALDGGYIISFGCGIGSCGADLVRIVSGAENLAPPTPSEKETLENLRVEDDMRLACVTIVTGDCVVDTSKRPAPPAGGAQLL